MPPSSSPAPVTLLPRVTVQDSFFDVVQEIKGGLNQAAEDTWVSVYQEGSSTVHGRVRILEGDQQGEVELAARDGVEVELVGPAELRVSCPALKVPPTPVGFPVATPFTLRGGLDCLDISPNGALAVVGGKDGAARVVDLKGSRRPLDLTGHVGDVRDVAFFPSNEVVLTASSDMSIRVFSAIDGSNPRTLTGHTKAVTAIAILGVGRVVASASLDGSIKLWTVGTAECLSTIRFTQPINSLAVATLPDPNGVEAELLSPDIPPNLVALVGHLNGSISVVSLSNKEPTIRSLDGGSSPLYAIAVDAERRLVAAGSRDGTIAIFDLSSSTPSATEGAQGEPPILTFKRSSSTILSLSFVSSTLLVGSADGLPFRVALGSDDGSVRVVEEFAGLDCDPAVVKERDGFVWVAAGDGKLRKYHGTRE
ncbi:proteasomal ATPase-associated factor 1 [Pseudohyphozyma bogoriensis]|nr:proteasomal ATPase-associated factor 1 [Pseudohyphozyma bogoriensis]